MKSKEESRSEPSLTTTMWTWFTLAIFGTLGIWFLVGLAPAYWFHRDWPTAGQFGDSFGVVNALFSGLAFAGVTRFEIKLSAFWRQPYLNGLLAIRDSPPVERLSEEQAAALHRIEQVTNTLASKLIPLAIVPPPKGVNQRLAEKILRMEKDFRLQWSAAFRSVDQTSFDSAQSALIHLETDFRQIMGSLSAYYELPTVTIVSQIQRLRRQERPPSNMRVSLEDRLQSFREDGTRISVALGELGNKLELSDRSENAAP